ncbi:DUF4354 family protein [Xenorhabdus budapestensis]|uniref:Uncharacterized protein n=1 Tax=Xenorhabdus budapestensis TaxID=290110 RepID=A0A2D0J5B5_XENBU|nr:DUF4354 family protein [Xenorhabdus budapestensis]PHM29697.1 hypothetical protein Xbud_00234 [Xenorhabdus budapestensis]
MSKLVVLVSLLFLPLIANAVDVNSKTVNNIPSEKDIFITVSDSILVTSTTENGVKHYSKKFFIEVFNSSDKNLSFATDIGCFKAEDYDGVISISQKIVDPVLLNPLSPKGENYGYIIFSSKDHSVLKTKFIVWSTDCSYMKRKNKILSH